jgi:hypothetical protein
MFTSAHLTSGVLVGVLLGMRGDALAAFVLASVFTDWDYAFQLLTGRNHRTFVTHSPFTYVALLLPLGFWWPLAWPLLAGSLLHFALDVWEYGIRLNPFRNRIFGARLIPGIETMTFRDYLRTYFRDKRFLGAEVAFAAGAVAALLVAFA